MPGKGSEGSGQLSLFAVVSGYKTVLPPWPSLLIQDELSTGDGLQPS